MAAHYLAISELIYLTQLELHRTASRRDFSSRALQRTFVSASADELGYPELVSSVRSGVFGSCISEGICSALHELSEPLMAAEGLPGGDGGPFDVLGGHLRENPVELTLVP